jgi:hypothetical protein
MNSLEWNVGKFCLRKEEQFFLLLLMLPAAAAPKKLCESERECGNDLLSQEALCDYQGVNGSSSNY